jgi:hypothetical protein
MPNQPLSSIPIGSTLEADARIVTVQTVASTVVNQRVPKALFFSEALASALIAANNLSDIIDSAAARENLGAGAVFFSTGAPSNATGIIGDVAIDTAAGVVYEKTGAATWTSRVDWVTAAELSALGYLTTSAANALYAPLEGAAQSGLRYSFSTTTSFPATTGQVRLDNATIGSVTQINIHESDRNSASNAGVLDILSTGSRIQIALESNEEIYAWFRVTGTPTDNGTDRTIPVAFISASGTLTAGEVSLGIFGGAGSGGGAVPVGSIYYQWATSTTVADPTAGFISANNATLASSTTISVNEEDETNANRATILNQIVAGGILRIQKLADGSYVDFNVSAATDNGAWRSYTVAYNAGSSSPVISLAASDSVALAWLPPVGAGGSSLTVAEVDGTPSFTASTLQFPNGTLTDQGGGVARYTPAEVGGGGGGLVTSTVTAEPTTAMGNYYICNSSTEMDFEVPSTSYTPGDEVGVGNIGTGGFKLRVPSGKNIIFGADNINTAAKFLGNSAQFAAVVMRALTANTLIVERSANIIDGEDIASFTKLLLRFNETAGSSTTADVVNPGRTITFNSTVSIVTGGRFGNALRIGANNSTTGAFYAQTTITDPLGTSDFCIEYFQDSVFTAAAGVSIQFHRAGSSLLSLNWPNGIDGVQPEIILGPSGAGGVLTASGVPTNLNATGYHHYAITRQAGVFRLFVDGIQRGSQSITYDFLSTPFDLRIGNSLTNTQSCNGDYDEIRLTIGDPVYTAAFTPPSAEFTYP